MKTRLLTTTTLLTVAVALIASAKPTPPAPVAIVKPAATAPAAATPNVAKPAPATQNVAAPMMIGVWAQPTSSFAKWKDRGINTLIRYEGEGGQVSIDAYCAAAVASKLNYVLQDDDELAGHWNDLNCVGVLLPDEANAKSNVYPYAPIPPATLAARRASIKDRTNKPILFNFDAVKMDWESDAEVKAYCDVADVIVFDRYLINRGEGLTTGWPRIVAIIQRLQRLAPGKPIVFFAECSDQNLKVQAWLHTKENQPQGEQWAAMMRGPTVQEMVYQLDGVIAAGCVAIIYFPDGIGVSFERFDACTDEQAAAMKAWNLAHVPIATPTPAPLPAPGAPDLPNTLIINGATYRKAA